MSICDKFGIIENHLKSEDKTVVASKIENYFENFLNSDMKVLAHDYINQVIWFDSVNFENFSINIDSQLKNYLIQRRNNMRTFIKKENFELSNLNKFLKTFIHKLEYLNNILKSSDDKVIKEGIKQLSNLIISDSFILLFIEEQIVTLNKDLLSEFESLIKLIKDLTNYDNGETYNKIIATFTNIFIKQIFKMEEPPLPENISRLYKLNEIIKYNEQVKEYFKFMKKDVSKINGQITSLIVENLTDIIRKNSLEEVEYVFENTWTNINKFLTENLANEIVSVKTNYISIEIIWLIERSMKNITLEKILKIINFLKYTSSIISQAAQKEIVIHKISSMLSSDEILDSLHLIIDSLIKESKDKEINILFGFINNIKDKDVFVAKYYQYLIKRLMEKISNLKLLNVISNEQLITEKMTANILKNKFGEKLVYKLFKVIQDTEMSFEENMNFNKLDINDFDNKMTVITTSYSNWDINQNEGLLTGKMIDSILHTQLGKHLTIYQKFYELKHQNKKVLNWFPHFGEVNITYLEKEIKMLPIQFMVLEMFNESERLIISEVTKAEFFKNYTTKFVNDIIGSLVSSGLFQIQNENLVLTTKDNFNTDLIGVFFNTTDYANIWEQKRNDELVMSREEIVYANINHEIKTRNMTKSQLFEIVKNAINVFELDKEIFNRSLNYMCKMEYVKENNELYEKMFY